MKKEQWGIFFPSINIVVKFTIIFLFLIIGINSNAQCTNTVSYGSATAPTSNTPTQISTCNFQTEYSTITSIVAGTTYQINSDCGGYITVRRDSFNGTVVSNGTAPHTFTAPTSGTYYIHYNTNAGCGTATNCCTTTITCTSCSAPVGCINNTSFGSAIAPTNNTPTTISTCNFQTEYSTISNIINGYASGQGSAAIYGQHITTATGGNTNVAGAFDATGLGYSTQPDWNIGVAGTGDEAGIYGSSNSSAGTRQGGYFTNSDGTNIQATASLAGYDNTNAFFYGGFFDGGQDSVGGAIVNPAGDINGDANTTDYAWVGVQIAGTNYKIVGGGSVSTIVNDENNKGKILFAPESPEITFTDSGVGKLVNGKAEIKIDPILSKNIFVDEKHPLKVFVQLEGDCNGVYVTEKSANGFTVKELQGGNSNVSFSWQLIANRADSKTSNGELISKHVDVRFPDAPKKPMKGTNKLSKTPTERKK